MRLQTNLYQFTYVNIDPRLLGDQFWQMPVSFPACSLRIRQRRKCSYLLLQHEPAIDTNTDSSYGSAHRRPSSLTHEVSI
jgi:hypothetical protein